jgi:hypothetical protein
LLVLHKQSASNIYLINSSLRPSWVDEFLVKPLQASGDL